MTRIKRLILALVLSSGFAPVLAQVPPPVPALPDTERRTSYSISGTTCACAIGFQIYGDGTDFSNWVEVFINGVLQSGNYTITSPTGSLSSIARPITDAVLTFTGAQTGTVQIVGARRPRRIAQFSENSGVSARNLNVAITDLVAQNREVWDKINDVTGRSVRAPPGETLALLPVLASRMNQGVCFDSGGNLTSCVSVPGSTIAAGAGITFTGTNPTTISAKLAVGSIPVTGGTPNGLFYDQAGVLGNLATANNGVLKTDGSGVPSISSTLPSALTIPSPTISSPAITGGTVTSSGIVSPAYSGTGTGTLTLSSAALDAMIVGNTARSNAFTINSQGDIGVGTYLTPDSTHHLSFEIQRAANDDQAFTLRNRNDGALARSVLHFFTGTADQMDASLSVGSIANGAGVNWLCGPAATGGCNFIQAANGPIAWFTNNTQRGQLTGAGAWVFTSASTTAAAANAVLDGSNQLLKSTSSIRYKKDLLDITGEEANEVLRLKPFTYASRAAADNPSSRFFGLAAEDVAAVDARLVNYDNEGRPDGVQYDRIVVPLLKKVQDMNACMESWKCRIFGVR